MGFRFRKSKNFDSLKVDLNKSGKGGKFKKIVKRTLWAFLAFIMFCVVASFFIELDVDEIDIDNKTVTMDVNDTETIDFKISPSSATYESLKIESTSSNIDTRINDDKIIINSKNAEGIYSFTVICDSVKSDPIKVKVINKTLEEQRKLADAQKIQEQKQKELEKQQKELEQQQKELELKQQKEKEQEKVKQNTTTSNKNTTSSNKKISSSSNKKKNTSSNNKNTSSSKKKNSSNNSSNKKETPKQNTNSKTVYLSRTGTKYHSKPNCGNMKSAIAVSLSEAKSRGKSPCKKCF